MYSLLVVMYSLLYIYFNFIEMKTTMLLPEYFKGLGLAVLLPGLLCLGLILANVELPWLRALVFALAYQGGFEPDVYFGWTEQNLLLTLGGVFAIAGGLMLAFARQPDEDECIARLRLDAFQWAVLCNYALLLLAFVFVYGLDFLYVVQLNLFTVLALFLLRFYFLLYQFRRLNDDE